MPAYFASAFDILGARSMILKGISLGAHGVIGAGFVFNKDALAFSRAAGNPARIVGTIATP
jgi:acetyltransferase-like isoleucine patch superfamily enzyme